jgi:hypothetical protein
MKRRSLLSLLVAGLLANSTGAQINEDPAIDVLLAQLKAISAMGRTGTYPNGMNGVAMSTTACNVGSKIVPWFQAMNPNHPMISFIAARETNGQFLQINDRSGVKHGFFALTSSDCATCQNPPGSGIYLGLGCSDTYATSNNGDNYWLGPPDEIDPWLGTWDPICSHFDMGFPPVAPPQDCDGNRSLTFGMASALNPVGNRMAIPDSEFNTPGSTFWFQGYYVVATEGDARRNDNMASRGFTATWSGTRWNLNATGTLINGTVLQRWNGASIDSNTNGNDDGRVYVAVKVTGPTDGMYHYEYAFHNRDNGRGIKNVRLPFCDGALVQNFGFHDVDDDPLNDWTMTPGTGELVFGNASNPLRWNSIYNVWFDSDAAPVTGAAATLDEADAGPGAPSFTVNTTAPLDNYNVWLGPGCANGTPPTLYATGSPARATIGNATFGVDSGGNAPLQTNVLVLGWLDGSLPLGGGCTQWMSGLLGAGYMVAGVTTSDSGGVASYSLPIPSDVSLEGVHVNLQAGGLNPSGGPLLGLFELSNGLRVRIGDSIPSCP